MDLATDLHELAVRLLGLGDQPDVRGTTAVMYGGFAAAPTSIGMFARSEHEAAPGGEPAGGDVWQALLLIWETSRPEGSNFQQGRRRSLMLRVERVVPSP